MYLFTDQKNIRKNRKQGAVLLIVLGIILLASWILVQIMGRVTEEVGLRGELEQSELIRACAFQSLEISIGVLAEIKLLDGALYSPQQGWGKPLVYAGFTGGLIDSNRLEFTEFAEETDSGNEEERGAGGLAEVVGFEFPPGIEVDVSIRDESGRFPLNKTTADRWKLLFEAMEIQSSDADILTDSLLDWIDKDGRTRLNGAESAEYQRRDPPYKPANRPIMDLMDLRYIEGFDRMFFDENGIPNERYKIFRECVTLMEPPAVNFNTASPLVLEVLAEEMDFEEERIADFLLGGDLEPNTEDDRVLRPGLDDPDVPTDNGGNPLDFSATCRYLSLYITTRSAGTVFRISARLDTEPPSENQIYPMTILDLQTKGSTL